MRCSAQALVTLVKAKLRFSRFPKEPELSKRAKSASCRWDGQAGSQEAWGCQQLPEALSLTSPAPQKAVAGRRARSSGLGQNGVSGRARPPPRLRGGSCLAGESLRS